MLFWIFNSLLVHIYAKCMHARHNTSVQRSSHADADLDALVLTLMSQLCGSLLAIA